MMATVAVIALVLGFLGSIVVTVRTLSIRRQIGSMPGNIGVICIDGLLMTLGLLLVVAAVTLGRRLDAWERTPNIVTAVLIVLFAGVMWSLIVRLHRWGRPSDDKPP